MIYHNTLFFLYIIIYNMQHFKYMINHDVWNVIYISHIIFHGIWFAQRQAVLRDIYCKNFWKFSAAHDNRGVQLSTRYVTICSLGRLSAKLEVSGIFARQLDLIQIQYRHNTNTLSWISVRRPCLELTHRDSASGPGQTIRLERKTLEKWKRCSSEKQFAPHHFLLF